MSQRGASLLVSAKINEQNRSVRTSGWGNSREPPVSRTLRSGLASEEIRGGHTSTGQSGSPPGRGDAVPRVFLEDEIESPIGGKGKPVCYLLS